MKLHSINKGVKETKLENNVDEFRDKKFGGIDLFVVSSTFQHFV